VECEPYESEKELKSRVASWPAFKDFQLVILHDSIEFARSQEKFLWATWTRFNPSTDITAAKVELVNNHVTYEGPVVIDSRMKPWYPKEVAPRDDIAELVDSRWKEYFPAPNWK